MSNFGLANFRREGGSVRAGLVANDEIFELPALINGIQITTLADVYERWSELSPILGDLKRSNGMPLAGVELLAPSLQPGGIYCAGFNYQDHIDAVCRLQNIPREPSLPELGEPPWHFIKSRNTLRGHKSSIPLFTDHIDWEIELAAIIGRTAKNVPVEHALDYVAGYTVGIDLSARDRVFRPAIGVGSPIRFDWIAQKSFDGACPLGPWLVPADQMGDIGKLDLRLLVDGRVRQDSNTDLMIYSTAEQIAYLSTVITLSPGDIILTGTPAGTGFESNEYLQSGNVVSAWIAGVGELTVRMT